MITFENCTRAQKQTIRCIASHFLYNVIRDRLEEFKKISNLFYKEKEESINEHYNLYNDWHSCIEVAFDLTLTKEELIISDNSDELWNAFFEVYSKQEDSFSFSNLLYDNRSNIKAAELVLNEWEIFLKGYRHANNKTSEDETS